MEPTDVKDIENEAEEEQNFGYIRVKFVQQGSVFFDFEVDGVVPMQMIAIGEYLSTLGKSKLLQEHARAQQEGTKQKIQVPQPGIDPGVLAKSISRK